MTVNCFVTGWKVCVLKELASIPAKSFDVLIVGFSQFSLEGPVHGPVSAQGALLVINSPGWSNS